MKLKLLGSLLAAALPIAAHAGGSGGTTTVTAVTVDTWDQLISLGGSWANPDSCGVHNIAIFQMSTTNYKDMLAAALTASSSGKTLTLWFNGCIATPWGNAPLVTVLTLN